MLSSSGYLQLLYSLHKVLAKDNGCYVTLRAFQFQGQYNKIFSIQSDQLSLALKWSLMFQCYHLSKDHSHN